MSSYTYLLRRPLFFVLVLHFFSSIAQATVPSSNTFTFLIDGIFDGLLEENQLYYTDLPFKTQPFALCVYGPESAFASNDTAFTLALRLDTRLVWQANRGKPVGKNSTVALRRDGNLVLANAKGNVVWQTNTANKGVVDIKLLANGNLVLLDKRGGFVWQSFDHPTDTILVGQSLFPGDENKLASRQGAYSLVLEGGRIVFNYKSKYSPQPQIYSLMGSLVLPLENTIIARMTLVSSPVNQEPYLFDLQFNFTYFTPDSSSSYSVVPPGLELKYNTTYSYLQLSQDGNLRIYT